MDKYRPLLHISPSIGWINDPNGFSYAKGRFHVFAQHNPYDTKWGPMHWLHFVSDDLVAFKEIGVALKPDKSYDDVFGCFSGSALEYNNQHVLVYTGAIIGKQQQCFAVSDDAVSYVKPRANPLIGEELLPKEYSIADFRDTFVFLHDGIFYLLVGARKKDGGSAILMYKSLDLEAYEYVGVTLETTGLPNEMFECPAVVFDGGKTALIYSVQFKKGPDRFHYQNVHSSLYALGRFDFTTGAFVKDGPETEIDFGFDFYAPQTMRKDHKTYMIAWQNMWDRVYPSAVNGYAGHLTMVRELKIAGDKLTQSFVGSLSGYQAETIKISERKSRETRVDVTNDNAYRLILDIEPHGKTVISFVKDDSVALTLSPVEQTMTFTRPDIKNADGTSNDRRTIPLVLENGRLHLDIVIDNCSFEALINHGQEAFAMTFFTNQENAFTIKSCSSNEFIIHGLTYHTLKGDAHHDE